MGAPVRYIIAFVLSLLLEFLFLKAIPQLLKPPKKEVNKVIKLSLFKPQLKERRITVEERKGKETSREVKKLKELPKPKVSSKTPKKSLPKKPPKREVLKKRESGGLKSLQGNLPVSYLEAVRRAIEENIFYPLEGIEKNLEGTVIVQFTLDREGKVISCKPLVGYRILEEATCLAIKRSKFPPIPESIKNDKLTFQLQLDYSLKSLKGQKPP